MRIFVCSTFVLWRAFFFSFSAAVAMFVFATHSSTIALSWPASYRFCYICGAGLSVAILFYAVRLFIFVVRSLSHYTSCVMLFLLPPVFGLALFRAMVLNCFCLAFLCKDAPSLSFLRFSVVTISSTFHLPHNLTC